MRRMLTYNRMVVSETEADRTDALFHALADATRRDILSVVLHDAHSVSDLARRYPISFAAVHKHVGALERSAPARALVGAAGLPRHGDRARSDAGRHRDLRDDRPGRRPARGPVAR